jgi:two-component system phosphate regulon sensor histidine kinase PhoR
LWFVKRIFTIIIVLITLSVIGIVILQISWLKNMLLLREDQVLQKVEDVTKMVGDELAQYKGSYPGVTNKKFPGFGDNFFTGTEQTLQRGTAVYGRGTL